MQALAELGVQQAALMEAAGVEDDRVSAFLSKMVPWHEESVLIEELFDHLSDRVMRELQWDHSESEEGASDIGTAVKRITMLLRSVIANSANIGSLDLEAAAHPSMAAALHFFTKTCGRIRRLVVALGSLADQAPTIKAHGELMDKLCQGKSAEEQRQVIKQMRLDYLSQLDVDNVNSQSSALEGTRYSLSDSPSSIDFKSASPIIWPGDIDHAVSPVLRLHSIVEEFVAAAAHLYSTEEYAGAAVQHMRAIHAFGHLPSRSTLAWMMLYGRRGVPQDHRQAAVLVAQGDLEGCTNCTGVLSLCLLQGWGIARDLGRALQLAHTSAAAGSRYGQFALGCIFDENSRNDGKALAQYRLSAAQGLDAAQYALGERYDAGDGVPADKEEAMRLFWLAAAHGFPSAFRALADRDDEMRRNFWLVQSALAGGDGGQRSLLALEAMCKAFQAGESEALGGSKQTRQVEDEGGDGGLRKCSKTEEE